MKRQMEAHERLDGLSAAVPLQPAPSRSASQILARELVRLRQQANSSHLRRASARRWNEVCRWFHWCTRPQTPYRAVFVLASPRSGSNLLIDYICRLPQVECLSEVLNWGLAIGPKKFLHPHKVVRHLQQSLHTLPAPFRGCKLFLHELEHYRLTIDDLQRAFPDAIYLVLCRENLAEQFVSAKMAKHTGQWILLPGQERKKGPVSVDPIELQQFCQEISRQYVSVTTNPAIANRRAIISYEQLVASPARCLREIVCPLLDVPYVDLQTGLCKQNVEPLSQRVANYSEVAELLDSPQCRLQLQAKRASDDQRRAA
jgi:LPS sulfotransferase NodH